MVLPNDKTCETSPLLPKPDQPRYDASHPIDASRGLVPEGADPYQDSGGQEDEEQSGGGIERQESGPRTHEGLPEVRKQMKYLMPALGIGVFLSAADQTIIVSSYGRIGSELNALSRTSWIATAYFLTLTAFQPLYGKLSDIFGRKPCLLFAYTVFGLGCLFCGIANDMNQLILARAFAGIGGGGMTTVVSILLSDAVSLRERGQWQGYINILYASGAATGAPLGGILSDTIGWRAAFLGQAPLCLLAFITVGLLLKMPKKNESHWKEKLRRVDFLGALVLLLAVVALLLGMDRGSNVSWRDRYTIACVSASVPLFALFVLVETYVATEPFAPGHIIFERSHLAAYLCNFFAFGGWLAALFFVPLYYQSVGNMSATQAGLRLIPSIIFGVSGSLFAGFYMKWSGRYYWITVVCYSTLVLGMVVVLLFSGLAVPSIGGMILGTMICAFSNGIGVTTTLIALIANATHEDQAVVTACSYLFRSLGSVMGVSLCATAANSALRVALAKELGDGANAEKIARKVRQSLEYVKTLEPEIAKIVRSCYGKSTQSAFTVGLLLVCGSAVAALFLKEKRLGR
ncbi:MFS general substrate transporter [Venturia nashicola]|uniref:MFS general substrate transporter n=1 Tax=Venturia nashicola TaxID=86259 RepID=A0A4Z1PI37_9PEZI|nr:MFS general substrate transporter [Venturia nashicola]